MNEAMNRRQDAMPSYASYQQLNPARSPAWRWERACALHAESAELSTSRDDELTIQAVGYIRAFGSSRCPERPVERLQHFHPDLHAAHYLHQHGGKLREEVVARLLAGQATGEIAGVVAA